MAHNKDWRMPRKEEKARWINSCATLQFRIGSSLPTYIANRQTVSSHPHLFTSAINPRMTFKQVEGVLHNIWRRDGQLSDTGIVLWCDADLVRITNQRFLGQKQVQLLISSQLELAPPRMHRALTSLDEAFPRL